MHALHYGAPRMGNSKIIFDDITFSGFINLLIIQNSNKSKMKTLTPIKFKYQNSEKLENNKNKIDNLVKKIKDMINNKIKKNVGKIDFINISCKDKKQIFKDEAKISTDKKNFILFIYNCENINLSINMKSDTNLFFIAINASGSLKFKNFTKIDDEYGEEENIESVEENIESVEENVDEENEESVEENVDEEKMEEEIIKSPYVNPIVIEEEIFTEKEINENTTVNIEENTKKIDETEQDTNTEDVDVKVEEEKNIQTLDVKTKSNLTLYIVIGVVLTLIVAILVYFFLIKKNEN